MKLNLWQEHSKGAVALVILLHHLDFSPQPEQNDDGDTLARLVARRWLRSPALNVPSKILLAMPLLQSENLEDVRNAVTLLETLDAKRVANLLERGRNQLRILGG